MVTVTGPRGKLERNFKHRQLAMAMVDGGKKMRVDLWFGKRKNVASVRTITSHIENMIVGVTKGFRYKMRFVYSHFPINVTIEGGKSVEIRNFLGEKKPMFVEMKADTVVRKSDDVKDQIEIEGNDITLVSGAASSIQQSTRVRNKDIRKFLDGIYVSEKGHIVQEEE